MKVLLHAYNTCCQNKAGGVQNRIKEIQSRLVQHNVIAELFNPYEHKVNDFDILHIFMLKSETLSLMRLAKSRGVKIVLSSIINIINGWKIDVYNRLLSRLPIVTTYKFEYEAIHLADLIIVETVKEAKFIQRHYDIDISKLKVIPNGIDSSQYKYDGKDIYNIIRNDKYLLQIGRFDENKNQLNVIKALKNTDIEVVFIGGADQSSPDYYKKCLNESSNSKNIHFLGWLDNNDPLFKSALHWAEALILPSYNETFGLVLLEAGINGAKLLISNTLPILSFNSFKRAYTFNPSNIRNIYEVVLNAMKEEKDPQLKMDIEDEFSWDTIIEQHVKLYNKLINDKKYTDKNI